MKTHTLFPSREARRVLGDMPASSFNVWANRITPVVPSAGRGTMRVLSLQQLWAISVAKEMLDSEQINSTAAAQIAQLLESLPPDEMERELAAGNDHIMVVNNEVCPTLLSAQAIREFHQETVVPAKKANHVTATAYINTRPLLDQLREHVEKSQRADGRKKKRGV